MTKKSSFLRQLNLYGFNRLCAAGPNQGSYYHEKFLRGMKFLCRRMHRQKVNGNGIRAAGNPDAEPDLEMYPPCPPLKPRGDDCFPGERRSSLIAPPPPPPPPLPPAVAATVAAKAGEVVQPRPQLAISGSFGYGHGTKPAYPRLAGAGSAVSSKNNVNHRLGGGSTVSSKNNIKNNGARHERHERRRTDTAASASGSELHKVRAESGGAGGKLSTVALTAAAGPGVGFPLKLQCILDKLEADGTTDVIRSVYLLALINTLALCFFPIRRHS